MQTEDADGYRVAYKSVRGGAVDVSGRPPAELLLDENWVCFLALLLRAIHTAPGVMDRLEAFLLGADSESPRIELGRLQMIVRDTTHEAMTAHHG